MVKGRAYSHLHYYKKICLLLIEQKGVWGFTSKQQLKSYQEKSHFVTLPTDDDIIILVGGTLGFQYKGQVMPCYPTFLFCCCFNS